MFLRNPELSRALLVACRWQRIVFAVCVGLGLQQIGLLLDDFGEGKYGFFHFWFFVSAGLWGSYCIVDSIARERQQNTWYWQMMMPLTPLQIVSGKFLGALVVPWLGGVIILLPALYGEAMPPTIITQALMSNALALLLATMLSHHQRGGVSVFFVTALSVFFPTVLQIDLFPFDRDINHPLHYHPLHQPGLYWYWQRWHPEVFAHLSFVFYAAWAGVGAWQRARVNKQHRTTPTLWAVFLATHIAYVYGFFSHHPDAPEAMAQATADDGAFVRLVFTAHILTLSAAYIAAFFVGNRQHEIQPFIAALRRAARGTTPADKQAAQSNAGSQGASRAAPASGGPQRSDAGWQGASRAAPAASWRDVWRTAPAWAVAFGLFVIVLAVNLLAVNLTPGAQSLIVAYAFYAVRDIAILLLFTLAANPRFAEGLAAVHLAILYLLIPALLTLSDLPDHWLVPTISTVDPSSILSACAQALIAAALLHRLRLRPQN